MTRRILHPSDFTSFSRAALKKAIEMAKSNRAELLLMNVISPVVPIPGDAYISAKMYDDLAGSAREFAQKQLGKLLAQAKKARVKARGFVLEGPPAEEIVRFARARRVDLIVMGTHGRGAVAHLLMGSVAERVVRTAPCPVLAVRNPEHEFVMPDALVAVSHA
jgi:nucleotide-binding universal stress UspA family protein